MSDSSKRKRPLVAENRYAKKSAAKAAANSKPAAKAKAKPRRARRTAKPRRGGILGFVERIARWIMQVIWAAFLVATVIYVVVMRFVAAGEGLPGADSPLTAVAVEIAAVAAAGYPFDGCSNEAVSSLLVPLASYPCVGWILGEESSKDESFSSLEQLEGINEGMQASILMNQSVNNSLATNLIGKDVLAVGDVIGDPVVPHVSVVDVVERL